MNARDWCDGREGIEEMLRLTMRVQELRDALREAEAELAARVVFSTRANTPRAPGRPRRWTRERVVVELNRFYRDQPRVTQSTLVAAGRSDLINAMLRWFGGIARAREMAGIPAPAIRTWTEEELLAEIVARHESGQPLNHTAMNRTLLASAVRMFGSWRAALETVGLDYDRLRVRRPAWTREEVIAELRARAARGEYEISGPFRTACCRLFGGARQARQAAGRPVPERSMTAWPKDRLMRELRARLLGRRPLGTGLRRAAKHVFGTIAAAREAVGVPFVRVPRKSERATWSRERVIRVLRATGDQLGGLDGDLECACRRYFGSVPEARRVAGTSARRNWTLQRIVDELRATANMSDPLDPRLAAVCRYYFGSVGQARRAAGVPAPPAGIHRKGR